MEKQTAQPERKRELLQKGGEVFKGKRATTTKALKQSNRNLILFD